MGDSAILKMICQIGIFIICAQTILHFKPKGSYEKYFKLLISIMILVQILQPLSGIFAQDGGTDLESRIWQIQKELEAKMEMSEADADKAMEILERMTLEEVNQYLQEAEEETLEDEMSEEYENTEIKEIESVEKIQIGEINDGSENKLSETGEIKGDRK